MLRCPGQDMRYWKPDAIYEVECPFCGREIEFWKDEPLRVCRHCGMDVRNPRMDLGCAKWCKFAAECLGTMADEHVKAAPIVERLRAKLKESLAEEAWRMAESVHSLADTLLTAEGGNPCVIRCAALCVGALSTDQSLTVEALSPLLTEAGLTEPTLLDAVSALAEAIFSGTPLGNPEYSVVRDALTLARAADATHVLSPADLLTEAAAVLAKHRCLL